MDGRTGWMPRGACSWWCPPPPSWRSVWWCGKTWPSQNLWAGEEWEEDQDRRVEDLLSWTSEFLSDSEVVLWIMSSSLRIDHCNLLSGCSKTSPETLIKSFFCSFFSVNLIVSAEMSKCVNISADQVVWKKKRNCFQSICLRKVIKAKNGLSLFHEGTLLLSL